MNWTALKYTGALISPIIISLSLFLGGLWTFSAVIYAFLLVPLLELFLPASERNMTKVEEALAKADPIYDVMVYAIVPIQYYLLGVFLYTVSTSTGLVWYEYVGLTTAMGTACGVFGINVAHELGHRTRRHEQIMAKMLLMTSLYMHFFIEHNRGHHKTVSTDEDPASARYGESLYAFWGRSVVYGWLHAWTLEADRLRAAGRPVISIHNEMLRMQVLQVLFVVAIGLLFGWMAAGLFIGAAVFGFLLLETVNYIEHYGLRRRKNEHGAWEKTLPVHSWNSNHPIGRILLFELSRHSDHHYIPSRPYQVLRHFDEAPQMPTGYPGMMFLSLFPPLWFRVMHKRIAALRAERPELG